MRGAARLLVARSRSSATAEPFLNGTSSSYVEAMYEEWSKDPSSVHKVTLTLTLSLLATSWRAV